MAEIADRIQEIRHRARTLPSDSGARVEALSLVDDARDMLDAAQVRLDRAELALDSTADTRDAVVGGWDIRQG